MIWHHLVVIISITPQLVNPRNKVHQYFLSHLIFLHYSFVFHAPDTSRSIPATGTDKNPQTEGLRLPERDKRHVDRHGTAEEDSPGAGKRTAHKRACSEQQEQPEPGQPQTVMSMICLFFRSQYVFYSFWVLVNFKRKNIKWSRRIKQATKDNLL